MKTDIVLDNINRECPTTKIYSNDIAREKSADEDAS